MKLARYPGPAYIAAKPAVQLPRSRECKSLVLGPIQFNWYAKGWRIYLTWPRPLVLYGRG
jgi:hypothetical protein